MGSWTRDSPYLPHVDSVASSFRILVTFSLVLEVRGISFFQILWTTYGRSSWTKGSQPECSWWVLHSILWLCQFYLSAWVIRKKYVELVRHTNLCIHNSESYMYLELSPFSYILTFIYQLIVRSIWQSCLSMPITLVVRQVILFQND